MDENRVIIEDRISFLQNQMETLHDDIHKLEDKKQKKINESINIEKDIDNMSYVLYCGMEKSIVRVAEEIREMVE